MLNLTNMSQPTSHACAHQDAPAPLTTQDDKFQMAAVSVLSRIADFWCDQPQLWFVQTEAILAPQKLNDETKFNLVVGKLGKDVIQQVSDLLRDPPATHKFDALKTRLISVYEESENRQFEKLLSQMELGEQKPSQLLRRMRDLARGKISDDTLCMLWMRHLPSSVRGVLTVTDTKNLESQAVVADKIVETMRPIDVAEVSRPGPSQVDTISSLGEQIAKLTAQFEQFQRTSRPWNRSRRGSFRNRSQSRPRSNNPPNHRRPTYPGDDGLCYYHHNYNDKARKCVQPCSWKRQGN